MDDSALGDLDPETLAGRTSSGASSARQAGILAWRRMQPRPPPVLWVNCLRAVRASHCHGGEMFATRESMRSRIKSMEMVEGGFDPRHPKMTRLSLVGTAPNPH